MEHLAKVQAEIVALLLETLNVEAPSINEDLLDTGLLDSLKIVELLVELEVRFGMTIPLNELEIDIFRSVAGIAGFIANHSQLQAVPNTVAA